MNMNDIATNIAKIRSQIDTYASNCGRDPARIQLLAVSKTKPAEDIRAAYAAGQTAFGENYLQEALSKIGQLQDLPLEWHFIGGIQSNKTRALAENFDWVHTLASEKHARRLNDQRPDNKSALNVCIQINVSGEASKGGIEPEEIMPLAQAIAEMPNLNLRGLMAIPAPTDDIDEQHQAFARLAKMQQAMQQAGIDTDTLSMGMSDDMQAAIEQGSTMVRIGTAIFGKRSASVET